MCERIRLVKISTGKVVLSSLIRAIRIDRHLAMLAVYNLLDNAIKYSTSGTSVIIDAGADKAESWFSFSNSSNALSTNDRDLIFNFGFRSPNAQRQNVSGQGIGLFIVRRIMESHGGSVQLVNTSGNVTFRLNFPLNVQEEIET
jgi:signal transduction histidine kinase